MVQWRRPPLLILSSRAILEEIIINNKGIGTGMVAVLVIVALVGGIFAASSGLLGQFSLPGSSEEVNEQAKLQASGVCNNDKTYALQLRAKNPLNDSTSSAEYLASSVRIYRDGEFVGTATLNSDGTFEEITTGIACGETYDVVVAAADGTSVSARLDGILIDQEDEFRTFDVAQNNDLSFRVRDLDQELFVYADTSTNNKAFQNTGAKFYNTTANATDGTDGLVVGSTDDVNYRIEVEADTSAADDEQYADPQGKLYIAVDIQSEEDWQEPTIDLLTGGSLSKVKSISSVLPRADSWDHLWTVDGWTLETGDNEQFVLRLDPKSGVNPDDNVVVGILQSGIHVKSGTDDVAIAVQDDSPSNSYVYAKQTLELVFS